MKMTRLFTITLMLVAFVLVGATSAFAQAGIAPSSQLGIGAFAGGNGLGGGASLQYAFSPSFQGGVTLGVFSFSQSGASSTTYNLELYGRFLFEGTVNPFVQVAFRHGDDGTTSGSSLGAGFGLEYFLNRNAGVYGMFDVIDLNFSPSSTAFGINSGRVGVEWYFSP
jgi:hypothetical protein